MENNFRFIHRRLLTDEDIMLSQKIEERANYVIQSEGGYANAAVALVVCLLQIGLNCGLTINNLIFANCSPPILKCIMKEIGLLSELFDCKFDTTGMVKLSKKVRQSAYELMLYEGPESAAAAGAMLVCSWLR